MKKSFLRASRPASYWTECYPIGNGNIGVMEDCGVLEDTLYLNDDRLWSGTGREKQKNAHNAYARAREEMLKENADEATKIVHDEVLSDWTEGYMPLGTLKIESSFQKAEGYSRTLDMNEGVLNYAFDAVNDDSAEKNHVVSESFASCPNRVFLKRVTTSKPASARFRMTSLLQNSVQVYQNGLLLSGTAPTYCAPVYHSDPNPVVYDPNNPGLQFAAELRIKTDGKMVPDSDNLNLTVQGYTFLEVYLMTEVAKVVDPLQLALRMDTVFNLGAEAIREEHRQDYKKLFDRAELVINGKESSPLDTESAMRQFYKGGGADEIVATLFDFGRYLTISGSREGTTAMNLQGIWNKELRAPWSSNYTININTEMNYWPTMKANLKECYSPLVGLIESMREGGKKTARETFGCSGFMAAHNTDVWGHTSPVGGASPDTGATCYGLFLSGGAWLVNEWAEACHYANDQSWVKRMVPMLTEAVQFYCDLLVEVDGEYITGLSTSPENYYKLGFRRGACVDKSSAMDMAIIRQLFKNFVWVSQNEEVDIQTLKKVEEILPKLRGYHFDRCGRVVEWHDEHRETDPHHRHISHLYGAFPGRELKEGGSPALYNGVEKTLHRRGMGGTGWSLSWKLNVYARLGKGAECYQLLRNQLRVVPSGSFIGFAGGGSYTSLLCAHPPFQIDGNFGVLSGIIEMLLCSVDGIELAPAVPEEWHTLKVRGLVAEGGRVINYDYKDGVPTLI